MTGNPAGKSAVLGVPFRRTVDQVSPNPEGNRAQRRKAKKLGIKARPATEEQP